MRWRWTPTATCCRPEAVSEPAAAWRALRGAAGRVGVAVEPVRGGLLRGRLGGAAGRIATAPRRLHLVRRRKRGAGIPGQSVRRRAGADADLERTPDPAARHRDHPGG